MDTWCVSIVMLKNSSLGLLHLMGEDVFFLGTLYFSATFVMEGNVSLEQDMFYHCYSVRIECDRQMTGPIQTPRWLLEESKCQ